jgi:AbrB family looped-hinge helix DNA binding protein
LPKYGLGFILINMKVGERGQVTIPKEIRDRFGLRAKTEVEFCLEGDSILLKKTPQALTFRKWRGKCKNGFSSLGYSSIDRFIDDVRGR